MPVTISVLVVGGEGFVCGSVGNTLVRKSRVKSPKFNVCGIADGSVWELHGREDEDDKVRDEVVARWGDPSEVGPIKSAEERSGSGLRAFAGLPLTALEQW